MTDHAWTLETAEREQTARGHTYTLTLAYGAYTASVSMRHGDTAPHYAVHKLRATRPPLAIWPEDGTRRPITRRSALWEPIQELLQVWTANVCSYAVHAHLDTHSPYCPKGCTVPVHVPTAPGGALR